MVAKPVSQGRGRRVHRADEHEDGWSDNSIFQRNGPRFRFDQDSETRSFFSTEEFDDTPSKINMFTNQQKQDGVKLSEITCVFIRKGQGNIHSSSGSSNNNVSENYEEENKCSDEDEDDISEEEYSFFCSGTAPAEFTNYDWIINLQN